jgi:hypothetical protein
MSVGTGLVVGAVASTESWRLFAAAARFGQAWGSAESSTRAGSNPMPSITVRTCAE